MPTQDAVDQAIARATQYLLASRSADGLWRDFHTLAGPSSDWVTAFVAHALASVGVERALLLIVWKALHHRQRRNGGWAYNASVPTDCDSTAWSLLALADGPMWRPSAIRHGVQFLAGHQDPASGGYSTYSASDGIESFIDVPSAMTAGWRRPHPCVTAVTIQSLRVHGQRCDNPVIQAAVSYMCRERELDGTWRSYWWRGPAYATYHALRALAMCHVEDAEARTVESTLLACQRADGAWAPEDGTSEAFATAFTVLALLLRPRRETLVVAKRGVAWLLERQREDGSWPTAPILRIPPPNVIEPDAHRLWRSDQLGTGVVIADQRAVFTTAAVTWAMGALKPMLRAGTGRRKLRLSR